MHTHTDICTHSHTHTLHLKQQEICGKWIWKKKIIEVITNCIICYLLVIGLSVVPMSRSLRSRRRRFPRRPIGPNAARAQPLPVHRGNRRLCLGLLDKRDKCIALALERLWVAHDTAVAYLAEGRERLLESLRLDLRRQVADEDVMMIARVQLGLIAGTCGPVNLHLLVEEAALVHGRQRGRCALMIGELDEGVRIVARLTYDLASLNLADLRE